MPPECYYSVKVAEHDQPDAHGVGELIYSGPNVMMGYAETGKDLGEGPLLTELGYGRE